MKDFDLSEKIELKYKIITGEDLIKVVDVKEFIERREARLRNQIRIHWKWLKNRPEEEVANFIVAVANAEAGEKLI